MSGFLAGLPSDFPARLAAGMAVDFEIAAASLGLGVLVGAPLCLVWTMPGRIRMLPGVLVQLSRAAPTFVVMFFLLNILPHEISLFGRKAVMGREFTVVLSLLPYSASYVAESGAEALRQWRANSALGALLLLPNLMRAFFVLVMSAGGAAAIGVTEGIAVILHQAERFPDLSDRLWLFAIGVLAFGAVLQSGFLVVMRLRRYLEYLLHRRQPSGPIDGNRRRHAGQA